MKKLSRKKMLVFQIVLSLFAVFVTGIVSFAWFQINDMGEATGSFSTDSTTLSVDQVTGYHYERDRINSSSIDYENGHGAAASVNVKGAVADNNIQEGTTTELDIPTGGMGFYCLNSYDSYKKASGVKMTNLSGNSRAKLDDYQVAAGDSIKFIQHATGNDGNSVDYNWNINELYSYDGTTQGLIGSTVTLSNNIISFSSAGTYYIVLNNDGRVELKRINTTGPSRSVKFTTNRIKRAISGPNFNESNTFYMLNDGSWWFNDLGTSNWLYMYWWNGSTSGWAKYTDSGMKYNDAVIYKFTATATPTKFILLRLKSDNGTFGNNDDNVHNKTGDLTWSATQNYDIPNGNTHTRSNFANVITDGWIIIGKSGTNSSTFGTGNFAVADATRLDAPANPNDNIGQITMDLNAGDKFKIYYMKNANTSTSNEWFGADKLEVYGGSVTDYFVNQTSGANCEVKSGVSIHCTIYFTKSKQINVNVTSSVIVKASKFSISGSFIESVEVGSKSVVLGATVTVSEINALSLSAVTNYTRNPASAVYSDENCGTQINTSFTANTNPKTVYIKVVEDYSTVYLLDQYDPGSNNSGLVNGRNVNKKTISSTFGKVTSTSASAVKSAWDSAGGTVDTTSGYGGGYSYNYVGIYYSNGTPFTSGTITTGTTLYVRYSPTTYNFTRRVEFWNAGVTAKDGKNDIALDSLNTVKSITEFTRTSPFAQGLHNNTNNIETETFGYEFDSWYVSYNAGSSWTKVVSGTRPTNNGILAARFKKLPTSTFYFDISETVAHQPGNENVNSGWIRNMTLKVYAYYGTDSATPVRNGVTTDGNFGVACTHIFQFHYKIELPNKATIVISDNYAGGSNQTGDVVLQDGLSASHNMIITGTVYNATYVGTSWGDYNDAWNPASSDNLSNNADDYFINFYDANGLDYSKAVKMTTGAAPGNLSSDQAHILAVPLQAGDQFVITKLNNGSKDRISYIFVHESIGINNETGQAWVYPYEQQGDQLGDTTNFAEMLSVDDYDLSHTSGLHMFKMKNSGVYDLFINNEGKVYFEQCELRLYYSSNSGSTWDYTDMHLGDGTNYFSILEYGQPLSVNDYVYISVKSNKVVKNYGWADMTSTEQNKGYAANSNSKIPEENSKYCIKILKAASYAAYAKIENSDIKIYLSDMPDKGEGYYIAQSDSGYYSFGKSIKMREIASPGNNASDYYYQYCAYTATANERIKLIQYANYHRKEVTSASGSGFTIGTVSGVANVITLQAGTYDIYIKKDLTSAVINKRSNLNDFFSLNTYSGMANQTAIKDQNTSMVFKIKVSWVAPTSGKTIKLRLTDSASGANVAKLGVKTTALLSSEVSGNPYTTIRTDYYSGLAKYNGDISVGSTTTASGYAYFYIIVDYWAGQTITSQVNFNMVVLMV